MPVHFPSHSQSHKIDGIQGEKERDSLDLMGKQQPEICLLKEPIFTECVNRVAEVQNYTLCENTD